MSRFPDLKIDTKWIRAQRGEKNTVSPEQPYHYFVEKEFVLPGIVEDVAVILLTNRECPYQCLMCDLWKNTTGQTVQKGAIPAQIDYALSRLPGTDHIKLYNSGSFFDPGAIPPEDYEDIARLLNHFETVIVESHPVFIGQNTLLFHKLLRPTLQVAVGLETAHPEILSRLNKHMTLKDFEKSIHFLTSNGISSRAFILLRPPFMTEAEGILWAQRSIDFAFASGVGFCSVIPVRSGNGAMEVLKDSGFFSEPDIRSLEKVMEYGIGLKSGPVFADLWDLEHFSSCDHCFPLRQERLMNMNLNQKIYPRVKCPCSD